MNESEFEESRSRILSDLEKSGIDYTSMSCQIELTAIRRVYFMRISEKLIEAGFEPVLVQHSREGNERHIENPLVKMWKDAGDAYQRGLKALGINIDAKERPAGGDDDPLQAFAERYKA